MSLALSQIIAQLAQALRRRAEATTVLSRSQAELETLADCLIEAEPALVAFLIARSRRSSIYQPGKAGRLCSQRELAKLLGVNEKSLRTARDRAMIRPDAIDGPTGRFMLRPSLEQLAASDRLPVPAIVTRAQAALRRLDATGNDADPEPSTVPAEKEAPPPPEPEPPPPVRDPERGPIRPPVGDLPPGEWEAPMVPPPAPVEPRDSACTAAMQLPDPELMTVADAIRMLRLEAVEVTAADPGQWQLNGGRVIAEAQLLERGRRIAKRKRRLQEIGVPVTIA